MSRSIFAERFRVTTGETAMSYLTRWRITVAADRLSRSAETLGTIARSVGDDSESAFGAAFKRVAGVSPRKFGRVRR